MNTLNSKANETNKFIYQFSDKLNIKNPNKNMARANLGIYYTWKIITSEYHNNKFKISAPTWNDEFNLPDGSPSASDIIFLSLIYFGTIADNPPVQIYVDKIKTGLSLK